MEPAPIQCGAIRPWGRPRRALGTVLVRLAAIAGLAFAGWIVLSALHGAASAAEHRPDAGQERGIGDDPLAYLRAPALRTSAQDDTSARDEPRDAADHPGRSLGGRVADGVSAVPERVREIGDHPVEYLRAQRNDALDVTDRTVRTVGENVRELAVAAGVPQVGIPDVRHAPIVNGIAAGVANPHPVLDGRLLPTAHEPANGGDTAADAADDAAHEHAKRAPSGGTAARAVHGAATGSPSGHAPRRDADGCPRHRHCGGGRQAPVPAPGPDDPGSAPAGGHQLTPVADLRSARHPAAPPAVDPSTFHRTALTDVSAPGGPSVVPD